MDSIEETPSAPAPEPAHASPEAQKTWQEYLQKCCEMGQLQIAIRRLNTQLVQIEKNLEVTETAASKLIVKHIDNQRMGLIATPEPTPETATEGTNH